jgi:Transposase DDE domain
MRQTREAMTQNLAERLCWQVARRDDARVARRLYRKQVVDGVYQLDEGALLDDFFYFLQELGVGDWLSDVQGTGMQREMVPVVQYLLLDSLKTLFGIESMHALPALLFSDEALMRLVGFNAQQVRQGVCQRGAARRQGPRTTGPLCPDALADHVVKLHLRDLETLFKSVIRALTRAQVFAAQVTGIVDATDLETTAQSAGCGSVTRQRKSMDTRGNVHEIEVTVYGWQLIVLIEAHTKIPLAAKVVSIQEHETLSLRALVTQARANLASPARLHKVVFDKGFLDGVDLWWLAQHGILFVVPAKGNMAVTVDAQAQAAAGEGVTVGRRVHTVRHGQGQTAWAERRETAVVGLVGLTTYDQYGTPAHGRHHNRRDLQPHPINAVVVRQWHGRDDGPGGNTVFLTNAAVDKPLQPFDDDDDRSLIENCCIKESTQQWSLTHPPQKTARAVYVHVLFTGLMFALATAYRLPCEHADTAGEPVGWQRWRRQLLEQTRDHVIVFAQGCYGIFHLAEYSLLLGVNIKDRPPGIGTRQQLLAQYRLTTHG